MIEPLKISPRSAGQVELACYCPRCTWRTLRIKKWPFSFGMPGIMFYMEKAQKAVILDHIDKHGKVPDYFAPFADCTKAVVFPFQMSHYHEESGVQLTARPDMMFERANGEGLLVDLKTAKADGGGSVFRPQYEVQVTGYSWVTKAESVSDISAAGLLYCEILLDEIVKSPAKCATKAGLAPPFQFKMHEVKLDYKRLTKCLIEMRKLWEEPSPPRGADGCKNCALLNYIFDFETNLRVKDYIMLRWGGQYRETAYTNEYHRILAAGVPRVLRDALDDELLSDEGMAWAHWDFDMPRNSEA